MFTEKEIKDRMKDSDVADFLMGFAKPHCKEFCGNHNYHALWKLYGVCPNCKKVYPKETYKEN